MQSVMTFLPRQGINANAHRKEKHFMRQWSVIDLDKGREVICLREYGTSTGASNSSCLWVFHGDYANGSGKAGGYGYHRPSAANEAAFEAAGVTFKNAFGGTGDTGTEDALRALADALGLRRYMIHKAHP